MNGKDAPAAMSMRELMPSVIEMLEDGQTVSLRVKGTSMQPFLMDGRDEILMVSPKDREPRVGDLYMFRRSDGSYAMHRVYRVFPDGSLDFVGDGQYTVEEGIARKALVAYVPKVVRDGETVDCEDESLRRKMVSGMRSRVRHRLFFRLRSGIESLARERGGRKDGTSDAQAAGGIGKLLSGLKNKDENIRLIKWMLNILRPYYRYVVYVFFISVFSMMLSYAGTIIGKYIVDDAVTGDISLRNVAIMCASSLFSIIMGVFTSILGSYIGEKFSFSVRQKLYDDMQRSVWIKISKYHSGDLVTRLTSDIAGLTDGLISLLPSTILIVIQLLISFFILFHYDRPMALFALVLGPVGALCMLFYRKRYKRYQRLFRESESEYRTFMQESLSDLMVVKSFRREDSNYAKMEEMKNKRIRLVIKNARLSSVMGALMRIVYSAGYVGAFCWGSYRISSGDITYGTLTVFITLVSQVQGSIRGLSGLIPRVYGMLVSAKRISDVTEIEKEVYSGRGGVPASVGAVFDNVSFSYDSDGGPVLRNVSFNAAPGEKVGIVGPSGAGKTTMIRLMLSLIRPDEGSIRYTLDDNETEDASPDARRFIAYVPQGNSLVTGTVSDNLRTGAPGADRRVMTRALRLASAEEFVSKLPEGLETELAERSGGISEGQAQRIAIARALISNKPVLILDEATSALDENTESEVLGNITRELKNTTCFIITHRRSMLKYCDKVIELDGSGGIRQNS